MLFCLFFKILYSLILSDTTLEPLEALEEREEGDSTLKFTYFFQKNVYKIGEGVGGYYFPRAIFLESFEVNSSQKHFLGLKAALL